ncbi:MAG: hypothetical protein WCB11_02395, partial [Terriglobales bacterium]
MNLRPLGPEADNKQYVFVEPPRERPLTFRLHCHFTDDRELPANVPRVGPALFVYEIASTWSFPGLSRKLSRERQQLCGRRGCSLWLWRPPRSPPDA